MAREALKRVLADVPASARPGYKLDVDATTKEVMAGLARSRRKTKPTEADVRGRAAGSAAEMDKLRATGGDPFAPSAIDLMTGRPNTLGLLPPAALAGGTAAGLMAQTGDAGAAELSPMQRSQYDALLSALLARTGGR